MPNPVFVLAIAGTSASGKSTVVKHLTADIDNSASLFFDDYHDADTYPANFEVFIEQDYDPNLFKSEKFAKDIARVRAGETLVSPRSETAISSPKILIIEDPTGRSRDIMQPLIDAVIWIDYPYDMALARNIIRGANRIDDREEKLEATLEFAEMYLNFLGDIYKNVGQKVKAQSDFLVDGTQSVDDIIEEIRTWLRLNCEI